VSDEDSRAESPSGPLEVSSPIINSPFYEPRLRWQARKGEPPMKAQGRRPASFYFRVPEHAERGRRRQAQPSLLPDAEVGEEEPLALVNLLRQQVHAWREGTLTGRAYDGASSVTRELIDSWRSEDRMQRLFFAQIEAAETAVFLIEAAAPYRKGLPEIPRDEPGAQARAGGVRGFTRYACKMATGTGKTTVMGMLSAWSILNRVAAPTDDRFSDTALVVCPNVTIRERLRELDPALGDLSLYRTRQLVPPHRMEELRRGELIIANWHQLAKKETSNVNGQPARVVKTGEAVEVVKNAGKANETVETKYFESDAAWFKRFRQELGSGRGRSPHWLRNRPGREVTVRVDSRVVEDLEEDGTSDETRRLRFILDTIGKPEWAGGKVPEDWSNLVRKHNEKVASDDNDGSLQWIDERIPPGRDVRCIVPVSMLAEGWDANTETHIVGLRPFGSQLLCEQVVGRALRRKSYALLDDGSEQFAEETAKVFGVPFELVPFKVREPRDNVTMPEPHHIYSVPEKADYEIVFPILTGYQQKGRFEVTVDWERVAQVTLDPMKVPQSVELTPLTAPEGALSAYGPGERPKLSLDAWRSETTCKPPFPPCWRPWARMARVLYGSFP
jgi:hypothetical protein